MQHYNFFVDWTLLQKKLRPGQRSTLFMKCNREPFTRADYWQNIRSQQMLCVKGPAKSLDRGLSALSPSLIYKMSHYLVSSLCVSLLQPGSPLSLLVSGGEVSHMLDSTLCQRAEESVSVSSRAVSGSNRVVSLSSRAKSVSNRVVSANNTAVPVSNSVVSE